MNISPPSPVLWQEVIMHLQYLIPSANILNPRQEQAIKKNLDQSHINLSYLAKIVINSVDDLMQAKQQIRQEVYKARKLYFQYYSELDNFKQQVDKAYQQAFNRLNLFLKTNGYLATYHKHPMIACYISTEYEANTHDLIKKLLNLGYRVCVPIVIDTKTESEKLNAKLKSLFEFLPMVWCEIKHLDLSDELAFTTNSWGIYEPAIRSAVQQFCQKTSLATIECCRLAFNEGQPLPLEHDMARQFKDIVPLEDIDIYIAPATLLSSSKQRIGMGGGYYDRNFARHKLATQSNPKVNCKILGYVYDWQVVAHIPYMTTLDINVDHMITIDTKINDLLIEKEILDLVV